MPIKHLLYLVTLPQWPILDQLKLEEAILRADGGNWCLFNQGTSPAIVLGISSSISQHIDLVRYQCHPLPVIRRFSGGGSVVVDMNTSFVTLICNVECSGVPCMPQKILEWNGSLYQPWLKNYNLRENDFALSDFKFGGNAQYLSKKRWLHHTTLLWDYSRERMELLAKPPKMPEYRQKREHAHFLCRLKDHLPRREQIFEGIREVLEKQFEVQEAPEEMLREILARPHRQSVREENLLQDL